MQMPVAELLIVRLWKYYEIAWPHHVVFRTTLGVLLEAATGSTRVMATALFLRVVGESGHGAGYRHNRDIIKDITCFCDSRVYHLSGLKLRFL